MKLPNVYETFFHNVCVGKTLCFYFCPHFYECFISDNIYHQSIIYEFKSEVSCCCLTWRTKFYLTFNFSNKKVGYFYDLKNLHIEYRNNAFFKKEVEFYSTAYHFE